MVTYAPQSALRLCPLIRPIVAWAGPIRRGLRPSDPKDPTITTAWAVPYA
jgi:hypothetical protein